MKSSFQKFGHSAIVSTKLTATGIVPDFHRLPFSSNSAGGRIGNRLQSKCGGKARIKKMISEKTEKKLTS